MALALVLVKNVIKYEIKMRPTPHKIIAMGKSSETEVVKKLDT